MELTFGASVNEEFPVDPSFLVTLVTLITEPLIVADPNSTLPSGNITLHFWFAPPKVSKFAVLSTVIWVVEALLILPDRLAPWRTGSLTEITEPGLTIAPASIDVVKLTTSDSFCSLNSIALPNLCACPREVQANAFTSFLTMPNFACAAVSSTTS